MIALMAVGAYLLRMYSLSVNEVFDDPRETLIWGLWGAIIGAFIGLGVEMLLRKK